VKVAAFAAKAKTPGLSGVRCGGAAGRNAAPNTSREQRRSSFKSERMTETGPWGHALTKLAEWDPAWADACKAMSTNPWRTDVLSAKFVELVSLAINVACTNLDAEGTRRHIRGALEAGATRNEILLIFKMASVMSIHACSLGAPILLEEAKAAGVTTKPAPPIPTPAVDRMKAIEQWNTAWEPFLAIDPGWTDAFMATGAGIYGSGVLQPKEVELLSIAFDASFTHMYTPGTRRHIQNALKAGASVEEIFEVLKICVAQGVQACNLGVPILEEELAARGAGDGRG
jgi:alkylhydroperoxidase/carboxymuconolactone decarboxylase family protein YurZ